MMPADAWVDHDPTPCPICGRESCEDHVPTPAAAPRSPLGFRSAAEIIDTPPPIEVIEGIGWADAVTLMVSESGVGKTFVTLSQAAATSAGASWFGRRTEPGSVAYVSYEGDAFGLRFRALRDVQGHALK